jgi:rhomboid family GlyGly-CTERM serine protease
MKLTEQLSVARRALPKIAVTLAIAVAALLAAASPQISGMLEFDRGGIVRGEWWRIFTCHITHWNAEHLQWDLLMFLVLGALCELKNPKRMPLCIAACIVAVSGTVFHFFPHIGHYRGLSGIDTALFALLAVNLLLEARAEKNRRQVIFAAGLLLAFAIKVGYEAATGSTYFVDQQAAGFVPLVWDHVVGAIMGAAAAVCPSVRCSVSRCPLARAGRSAR